MISANFDFGRDRVPHRVSLALLFLLGVAAAPALSMPTIDGLVVASEYDYDFTVALTTEDGVGSSGQFFVHDDGTNISIGLIADLGLNDNTYGGTRASDWGSDEHNLAAGGGGKSLEGSDKWEIKGWAGSDIEIDYIDEPSWDALDKKGNLVAFGTSIALNHDNYPGFFSTADIDSPAMNCGGPLGTRCTSYDFDTSGIGGADVGNWIPEIMYEFSASRATLGASSGISSLAEAKTLANDILAASTIHMSPNKLGKNKVCEPGNADAPCFVTTETGPGPGTPMPEPGSIALLGIGMLALVARRRRMGQ